MPDSEFFKKELANVVLQASFDGRLKSAEAQRTTTGDLVSLTAATGKDLYLTRAVADFFFDESNSSDFGSRCELKVNAVIKETDAYSGGQASSGFGGSTSVAYEFKNLFHKVTAAQILKLEVTSIAVKTRIEGFIQAVEVPTGLNPLTYRGA